MTPKEIRILARRLLNQHGLVDWGFKFDRAKRRAGCCKYAKKTITLSKYYIALNNEEDITNSLKHEIAHALAGWAAGHNKHWQGICCQIGAKPERCYGKHVKMPEPKLVAQCPKCSRVFKRHRQSKRQMHCRRCGPLHGKISFSSIKDSP